MIEPGLARRLKQATRRITKATDERDALIVEAVQGGASHREVAALVGLSHPTISEIVRRHDTEPEED